MRSVVKLTSYSATTATATTYTTPSSHQPVQVTAQQPRGIALVGLTNANPRLSRNSTQDDEWPEPPPLQPTIVRPTVTQPIPADIGAQNTLTPSITTTNVALQNAVTASPTTRPIATQSTNNGPPPPYSQQVPSTAFHHTNPFLVDLPVTSNVAVLQPTPIANSTNTASTQPAHSYM